MENNIDFKASIRIGFMNIKGQSKLKIEKQIQIETFLKQFKCDVLHLQETNIESDTFSTCSYIYNNYNIFQNNSINKYGTSSLVKSDLLVENIKCDTEGEDISL